MKGVVDSARKRRGDAILGKGVEAAFQELSLKKIGSVEETRREGTSLTPGKF